MKKADAWFFFQLFLEHNQIRTQRWLVRWSGRIELWLQIVGHDAPGGGILGPRLAWRVACIVFP